MIDETQRYIRDIADGAGWSDDALLFLIARWAEETGQARALLDYLDQIATEVDDADAFD